MSVLHDYDMPSLRSRWALKRGLKLILYAFMKKLGLTWGVKDIYTETDAYAVTLVKLDALAKVLPVVGLRDIVEAEKPHLRLELTELGADVHGHVHIGDDRDPYRTRIHIPPLKHRPETWRYDQKWVDGAAPLLEEGELPIWHIDYPWMIGDYIDFLYRWRVKGEKIYG